MTNSEIWRIALQQSAYDCNCRPEDFLSGKHLITQSVANPLARKYLPLPFACEMVSYGSNIVAQTNSALAPVAKAYLERYDTAHAFETPHIHALDEMLAPHGYKTCFMAEYFLPDVDLLKELPCAYELRLLHPADFADLYTPEWSNALCQKRKELDVLAVGAYDGGRLVGMAGCSADCAEMYQIGIDVLPDYRRQGIASALTSRLALEVLKLGKVPFYCCAWCNIPSARNAIRSGFRPAWVTLTARAIDYVNELNQR